MTSFKINNNKTYHIRQEKTVSTLRHYDENVWVKKIITEHRYYIRWEKTVIALAHYVYDLWLSLDILFVDQVA